MEFYTAREETEQNPNEMDGNTPVCTPACQMHQESIPHSVSFDINRPNRRISRDSVATTPKERLVVKESLLLCMLIISVLVIVPCFILIGYYNSCEINGICSSIILSILSAWTTQLGSAKLLNPRK
jgi:hypothetical protein